MNPQRTILCMKWGSKYGPEYINRLYAMVRRHLRGEHLQREQQVLTAVVLQ